MAFPPVIFAQGRRVSYHARALACTGLLLAGVLANAEEPARTAIREIKMLTPGEAARRTVAVEGVVTHSTPAHYGCRELVAQDESGGIWITGVLAARSDLPQGSRIRASGRLVPGKFSPTLEAESFVRLGTEALPPAREVELASLLSGGYDGVLVSVIGRVQSVREITFLKDPWVLLGIGPRTHRLHAMVPGRLTPTASEWLDRLVEITGVGAHYFNPSGQIVNAQLRLAASNQVRLLDDAPAGRMPPLVGIEQLLSYVPGIDFNHRVRTKGVVTAHHGDGWMIITEGRASTRVWSEASPSPPVGALVEACGFAVPGSWAPEIEDATVQVIGTGERSAGTRATFEEALGLGGRLVTLRGRVFSVERVGEGVRLLLESEGKAWSAAIPVPFESMPKEVCTDAMVEVTGISMVRMGVVPGSGSYPAMLGVEVAARDLQDVRLVALTPWWTEERIRLGAVASLALSCALGTLTIRQRRRNRRLAAAKASLTSARDQLAREVETRRDQLQEQLVRQHQSCSEAAAVMVERARVARDLHDSLGQTLASAKWRVETLNDGLIPTGEKTITDQLQAVSGLLQSSQQELRRSVWNLRNPGLDREHLADTLREAIRLLFDHTHIAAELVLSGSAAPLPLPVETNILRFTQECLANVLKHASAHHVRVTLSYGAETLQVSVSDDGIGFDASPDGQARRAGSHFGLEDLRERSQAIRGEMQITSAPGIGTLVRLNVPLPPPGDATPPTTPGGEPRLLSLSS